MPRVCILLLLGLLIIGSCVPFSGVTTPTPTVKPYPALAAPVVPSAPASPLRLTIEQLNNAEYTTYVFFPEPRTYVLTDGQYRQGTDPTSPDYVSVVLLERFAFGDLNGDELEDAAVLLSESHGGAGTFVSLIAVLNQEGKPAQAAAVLVDNPLMVNDLTISNGQILLDALVHGFEDAECCPTFPVRRAYLLLENELVLVRQISQAPGGQERMIAISSPASGASASGSVVVQGNVTIAPFENNLVYRIYHPSGGLLTSGPVAVSAPEMGAPGTFAVSIPLDGMPADVPLRLEILDLSMADGSILALDSIFLTVR